MIILRLPVVRMAYIFAFLVLLIQSSAGNANHNQCDSTKCIGGGLETSLLSLGECWGSETNASFPFLCEEGYQVHNFSLSLKLVNESGLPSDLSYYTCCKNTMNAQDTNAIQCIDTACTSDGGECLVYEPWETKACGIDDFRFGQPTGFSKFYPEYNIFLNLYMCCNEKLSEDAEENFPSKCNETFCSSSDDVNEGDCWANLPYEAMTCDSEEFRFSHPTGRSAVYDKWKIDHYTCCSERVSEEDEENVQQICSSAFCTSLSNDCWIDEVYDSMTCDSDQEYYIPQQTGVSLLLEETDLLIYEYKCCNRIVNGEVPEENNLILVETILSAISGLISMVSSISLIWMISRSKNGFSKVSHRILTGLSIADILYSLRYVLLNIYSPKELSDKFWTASGNDATCLCASVIISFSMICAQYYNASLNVYYLFVVKYEKSEDWIRKRVEPLLHILSVLVGLSFMIYTLITDTTDKYGCSLVNDAWIVALCFIGVSWAIIIISLGMIYWKVRSQVRKMSKYGQGALRVSNESQAGAKRSRLDSFLSSFSNSLKRSRRVEQSKIGAASKSVLYKALAYSIALFLTYIFHLIYVTEIANVKAVVILAAIFHPLQGFWNFFIFMYPKVLAAKKNGNTWCEAIRKAFSSQKKSQGSSISKTTKSRFSRLASSSTKFMSQQVSRVSVSREKTQAPEEEKNEIGDSEVASSSSTIQQYPKFSQNAVCQAEMNSIRDAQNTSTTKSSSLLSSIEEEEISSSMKRTKSISSSMTRTKSIISGELPQI